MKIEKTDRTVLVAFVCGLINIFLLLIAIIAEIFFDISQFIPLVFAAYTILNVLYCTLIPNSPRSKWKSKTLRFIIPFCIMELVFVIPYIAILFVESIL